LSKLSQPTAAVSPSVTAALLLCAREPLSRLELPGPSAAQVLQATGARRSRAYELSGQLQDFLPSLQRPPGRPAGAKPAAVVATDDLQQLTLEVLAFVMGHPGCVVTGPGRAHYHDAFRRRVLDLRRQHRDLDLDVFAAAVAVPLGTLKGWLAQPSSALITTGQPDSDAPDPTVENTTAPTNAWIETTLSEWECWTGDFVTFCSHLQQHCRVPLGRSAIARILESCGVRLRHRREGRSPDEEATRGSFETFFPGAQWVGDGSEITVVLGHEPFHFNLELMVDTYSDAFVGLAVTDTEDSAAVASAFADGMQTTGQPPLDILLDNRPSNHTPEVDAALGPETLRTRSTPGRPQSKAHVEGAFGLFAQTLPALAVIATTPREQARQIAQLVFTTLARAINHRPRRDRRGRSRVDLYTDQPTPEQVAEARAALLERHHKQQLAQQTLLARQDPLVLLLIDQALERFRLTDPDQHFAAAIARHGRDAALEGIAIFDGKRAAGTLPDDADIRYLLGIVRNVAGDNELCEITESLIASRLAARDVALQMLRNDRAVSEKLRPDPAQRIAHHADRAASARRKIDRFFWARATADAIVASSQHADARAEWTRYAAARINVATHLPHRERCHLIRLLTRHTLPVT
jgi:hypothetical protein